MKPGTRLVIFLMVASLCVAVIAFSVSISNKIDTDNAKATKVALTAAAPVSK